VNRRSVAFGLLLSGCAASHAPGDGAAAPVRASATYLALGDSFTIGTGSTPAESFPARLVSRWTCPVELHNDGVDGFTSENVIDVELPDLKTFSPGFVTLLVGANDIVHRESPDTYRAHLRTVFQAIHAANVARVVVLPQPDWSLSPVARAFGAPSDLHAEIVLFNGILRDEAASAGAEFVDLFPLMEQEARERMIASDGLHPSAAAYDAWAAELARRVASPCGASAAAR
jgi:lysophospholipase L1-like esterase